MAPDPSDGGAERAEISSAAVAGDPADAVRDAEAKIRSLAQKVTELARAREDDRRVAAAVTAQAETRAQSAEERAAAATVRAESAEQATQPALSRAAAVETELAAQERDELERQAAAYDEVAVKARERATAAEAANDRTTSTLDELQVWHAELERRLAETTTELGALRARRDADERELVRLRAAVDEEGRGGGPAGINGAGSEGDDDGIVAIQAQEIQRLAAALAELRSRAAHNG